MQQGSVLTKTQPELNFAPVPEPPVISGTRTGTRLCPRNRYQALSLVPGPGPVTGNESGTRLCHWNRYQALEPELEPVPGSVTIAIGTNKLQI